MPLTSQQLTALEKIADERGVDRAELIAVAEAMSSDAPRDGSKESEPSDDGKQPSAEPPKLFMYHLPFVRVREVRKIWLGLDESFPGDEAIAAEWAAKFTAGGGGGEPPPESA